MIFFISYRHRLLAKRFQKLNHNALINANVNIHNLVTKIDCVDSICKLYKTRISDSRSFVLLSLLPFTKQYSLRKQCAIALSAASDILDNIEKKIKNIKPEEIKKDLPIYTKEPEIDLPRVYDSPVLSAKQHNKFLIRNNKLNELDNQSAYRRAYYLQ